MIVNYLYDSDKLHINEERYYMKHPGVNFSRTSAGTDGRLKGLVKALPMMAITTAISWPLALLSAIGALSYRWQKRWEDRDAKRHIFTQAYWTEYLANSHKKDSKKKNSGSFWGSDKDNNTEVDNRRTGLSTAAVAGTGALAGGLLADKLKKYEQTPEERKTEDYKIFWVTFSNGEIIRVRAFDERGARELCNEIIKQTETPVYKKLNNNITLGFSRYKFYLDSGEIVYWSGKDKKSAFDEAYKTRIELCEVLNKEYPNLTKMEPMETPKRAIRTESNKSEKIPLPEYNKFVVSETKPDFSKQEKSTKKFYQWGSLKHFETSFGVFTKICFPAETVTEAEKIVRDFYSGISDVTDKLVEMLNNRTKAYKITFNDKDIYHIPGKDKDSAVTLAEKIHNAKINAFEHNLYGTAKDDYNELIDEFNRTSKGTTIYKIKSIEDTPDSYSVKKTNKFKLVYYIDNKNSVESGPYNLW